MKYIKLNTVLEMTGRSRTVTYRDIAHGTFPKQVKIGSSSFWVESEVIAWMENHITQRDS